MWGDMSSKVEKIELKRVRATYIPGVMMTQMKKCITGKTESCTPITVGARCDGKEPFPTFREKYLFMLGGSSSSSIAMIRKCDKPRPRGFFELSEEGLTKMGHEPVKDSADDKTTKRLFSVEEIAKMRRIFQPNYDKLEELEAQRKARKGPDSDAKIDYPESYEITPVSEIYKDRFRFWPLGVPPSNFTGPVKDNPDASLTPEEYKRFNALNPFNFRWLQDSKKKMEEAMRKVAKEFVRTKVEKDSRFTAKEKDELAGRVSARTNDIRDGMTLGDLIAGEAERMLSEKKGKAGR